MKKLIIAVIILFSSCVVLAKAQWVKKCLYLGKYSYWYMVYNEGIAIPLTDPSGELIKCKGK